MDPLETTGKTVDEATAKALSQLGAERDEVEVVVVDKGRSGVFGIGAEEARVRVTLLKQETADPLELAKETIESLLRAMGVSATVALPESAGLLEQAQEEPLREGEEAEPKQLRFSIEGEDAGLLIGHGGETLNALQFLVNLTVSRQAGQRINASIDIEGYRERREERLTAMANRLAERVAQTGRAFAMEPMAARDRRIIHMALANSRRVRTESVGEGEGRKVTIYPKREGGAGGNGGPREPRQPTDNRVRGGGFGRAVSTPPPDERDLDEQP